MPQRNQAALLFRQMDGGELWYESVLFDPLLRSKLSKEEEKKFEEEEDFLYSTIPSITTKSSDKEEEMWPSELLLRDLTREKDYEREQFTQEVPEEDLEVRAAFGFLLLPIYSISLF